MESIAGGGPRGFGFCDGIGDAVKFNFAYHGPAPQLLCTTDGHTCYFSDRFNNRLRAIHFDTRAVVTVGGNGEARDRDGSPAINASIGDVMGLCFDVTTAAQESVLLFTTSEEHGTLRRLALPLTPSQQSR